MALYEHVILVRQDVTAQQVEAINEQFKGVIEANGGKVTKVEYWGVKTLAFRIKKNRKAHFTLLNVDAPHTAVAEVERLEAISEDVIRSLTIRVEALEEGPSARSAIVMMTVVIVVRAAVQVAAASVVEAAAAALRVPPVVKKAMPKRRASDVSC
jgi:small subunit ribosomal protein S6